MQEIKLSKNEYIAVDEYGKIQIQCEDKPLIEFKNLEEMVSYLKPEVFDLMEIKYKLNDMKFESNETKLFTAYWYEYECLNNYVVIVARNQKEAELLFEKYLIENCEDAGVKEPEEVMQNDELYEDLYNEYGDKIIGVYKW